MPSFFFTGLLVNLIFQTGKGTPHTHIQKKIYAYVSALEQEVTDAKLQRIQEAVNETK